MAQSLIDRSHQYSAALNSEYSLRNVLLDGSHNQDTLEAEISRRISNDREGVQPAGIYVPFEALYKKVETRAGDLSASAGSSTGGALVPSLLRETADVLRPYSACVAAGATVLTGVSGNIVWPRMGSGTGPLFVLENSTSYGAGSGAVTFSQLSLTPHRLTDEIRISTWLLKQAQFSVSELIQRTILRDIGSMIDFAAIQGNSTANTAQPNGILNMSEATNDYSKLSTGVTFSGAATWANLLKFPYAVKLQNVVDDGTFGWLVSPATEQRWRQIPKVATYPEFLMDNAGIVAGAPSYVTTNLLSGNQCIFGRFSDLIIAIFYLDILSDPYTYGNLGQMRIVVNLGMDVGVLHGPALIKSEDTAAA